MAGKFYIDEGSAVATSSSSGGACIWTGTCISMCRLGVVSRHFQSYYCCGFQHQRVVYEERGVYLAIYGQSLELWVLFARGVSVNWYAF